MTLKQYLKLYLFAAQYEVRDMIAAILQDIAEWVRP